MKMKRDESIHSFLCQLVQAVSHVNMMQTQTICNLAKGTTLILLKMIINLIIVLASIKWIRGSTITRSHHGPKDA